MSKLFNWRNKEVILRDEKTHLRFDIGDVVKTFRGNVETIKYIEPPHKPSASGKVNNYYAGVYGLEFVEI